MVKHVINTNSIFQVFLIDANRDRNLACLLFESSLPLENGPMHISVCVVWFHLLKFQILFPKGEIKVPEHNWEKKWTTLLTWMVKLKFNSTKSTIPRQWVMTDWTWISNRTLITETILWNFLITQDCELEKAALWTD